MEESSNKPPSAAANPPSLQRMVTPENATAVVLFLETSKRSLSSEEVVVSSDSLDSRSNKKSRGRCEDPTTAASSEALKKLDRACPCPLTFPSTTTTTTTTADPLFAPHKRSKDLVEFPTFWKENHKGMQEATVDEPEVNHEGFLEELDHALALSLQQEFDTQAAYSTATGKAWDFADRVTANHRRLLAYDQYAPNMNANNFSPVAPDDMVFLAERLFATQEAFRQQGKDARVDIGYHYTKLECMERIRTDGLLTKAERQAANISSISNGATFGDGIYTGMNAFSYHKFCGGDQGLLVARLQGLVVARPDGDNGVAVMGGADTVIGRGGSCDAVCVLQSSSQCLALVKFSADLIELENDASIGNEMVHAYHCSLQEIVDECFNGGVKTLVPKLLPSRVQQHRYDLHRIATSSQVIRYTAPGALSCADVSKALILIKAESATKGECSICLADLAEQGPVVSLADCSHRFHQACIEESAKITRKCPNCRAPIGAPQGTMPSGTMQIEFRSDLVCSGHNSGTIRIKYEIDAGLQMVYHDHPGEYHEGTVRVAYLPDIQEGRNLLKRLKFAFLRGLTFTVGTSHTSGRPNSVTWTSIHHKTSLCEGAHGYPDLGYFINANEELDALHVPSSDAL